MAPELLSTRAASVHLLPFQAIAGASKLAVRWLSQHTGLPALVVAAALVVIGYRLLKRSFRFAVEVAVVGLVLAAANELGWLRW